MLRAVLLAVLLAPLAAAQPLVAAQPLAAAAIASPVGIVTPEAERLRVALVVQRADDGGSCDGGGCDGADCSGSDGGRCDGGDLETPVCLALGGCAVLTAGAGYGLWRLVKRRRGPREDTLDTASPVIESLARRLSPYVEIVAPSPEADVTLTVRETTRRGVGLGSAATRLEITARDRTGRPLALDDGPIPSTRLVLPADASLPDRVDALARRLAQ